ncbi:MAG: hypothetical protein J6B91_03910 [Prevotella sp.]|nr:hypothetical protein [Prevotella sp.]
MKIGKRTAKHFIFTHFIVSAKIQKNPDIRHYYHRLLSKAPSNLPKRGGEGIGKWRNYGRERDTYSPFSLPYPLVASLLRMLGETPEYFLFLLLPTI